MWNIFANADFPQPQASIRARLCEAFPPMHCPSDETLLASAVARFKTPGLRDLGHSAPYMHMGQFDTLEAIIEFYIDSANQARRGTLRNAAAELLGVALTPQDIAPLTALLNSLNEDYQ